MSKIDVIVSHPGGRGWGQIENLAILAATELDAELHRHTASSEYSRMHVARTLVPPRRDAKSDRVAIVIAPQPAHLNAILAAPHWRQQYRTVVGWVIDSFWTDRVPRVARSTSYYDHLFVMDPDDIEPWRTQIAATVSALPWGADVLGMPFSSERTMDLQRIGRQPDAWDDDNVTAAAAEALGLTFAGRPPFGSNDEASASLADGAAANAKFVLAFSNRAHQSSYTHPTREYVTGRWLDALAAGASVAGIAPRTAVADALFWPGACLDFPSVELHEGLAVVQDAVSAWTPGDARRNRRLALERLDWRHRLKELAGRAELTTPRLDASLRKVAEEARVWAGDDGAY